MSKTVLYMSMSVGGFIAGPNEGPGNGLGDGGHRLHEWFLPGPGAGRQGAAERLTGVNREVTDEAMATGAVVVGRRTFELAEGWGGDHHHGVPVFVLTHDVPGDPPPGSVRYVTDAHECASQARTAAGDGDVMVHGAGAAQALLRAGQLDEIELHVVPVLLGQGRRLFGTLPAGHVELDLIRRLTTPAEEEPARQVMHLHYRVRQAATGNARSAS